MCTVLLLPGVNPTAVLLPGVNPTAVMLLGLNPTAVNKSIYLYLYIIPPMLHIHI